MKPEERNIKASICAGVSDIIFGLILYKLDWIEWYFQRFHFFGIMGMAMLFYSFWYIYFYRKDTGKSLW